MSKEPKITPEQRDARLRGDEANVAEYALNMYRLLPKFVRMARRVGELRERGEVVEADMVGDELIGLLQSLDPEAADVAGSYLLYALTAGLAKEKLQIIGQHTSIEGRRGGWKNQTNAEKYRASIKASADRKALGCTREECIEAARARLPTGKGVKRLSEKQLSRILSENNALPAARKKLKDG